MNRRALLFSTLAALAAACAAHKPKPPGLPSAVTRAQAESDLKANHPDVAYGEFGRVIQLDAQYLAQHPDDPEATLDLIHAYRQKAALAYGTMNKLAEAQQVAQTALSLANDWCHGSHAQPPPPGKQSPYCVLSDDLNKDVAAYQQQPAR